MIRIDRIEGERAILEVDGELVELPRSALPPGAAEGAGLQLQLLPDDSQALERAQARLDRLRAKNKLPDDIEL